MNRSMCFAVLIACAYVSPAIAQPKGFADNLKPGQRIEVNIAGYKYQGTFTGYAKCSDGAACATILADDGNRKTMQLRYIRPSSAPARTAAPPASTAGAVASGKYTCTFFSGTLQNVPGFTLHAGGKFTDHAGSGSWSNAGGVISFSGGAWTGQKAKITGNGKMQVLKANGSMGAVTCGLSR